MRGRSALLILLAALLLVLPACTIRVVPGDVSGVIVVDPGPPPRPAPISSFRSSRSNYRVGDLVSFEIVTRESGYVTLTAIDPDGYVYVIARNVRVQGRQRVTIPDPNGRIVFRADPPTGPHAVRAHFTPARTAERVVFHGVSGSGAWTLAIRAELEGSGYLVEDVAEVRFNILSRF